MNRRELGNAGRRFASTKPGALALGVRFIEFAACKVARIGRMRFFWRPYRTQTLLLQLPRVETLGYDLWDFQPHLWKTQFNEISSESS